MAGSKCERTGMEEVAMDFSTLDSGSLSSTFWASEDLVGFSKERYFRVIEGRLRCCVMLLLGTWGTDATDFLLFFCVGADGWSPRRGYVDAWHWRAEVSFLRSGEFGFAF